MFGPVFSSIWSGGERATGIAWGAMAGYPRQPDRERGVSGGAVCRGASGAGAERRGERAISARCCCTDRWCHRGPPVPALLRHAEVTVSTRIGGAQGARPGRFISPPREELGSLRQPLEAGERRFFDFLDEHLPPAWEIYVQPHLNGLRPDFVLLNPAVGIGVFEVKNWNLDAIERWTVDRPGRAPELLGRIDGKPVSLQRENPVEKVHRYKTEIHDLYCPRIDQASGLALITAGVVFPSADDERVAALLGPSLEYRNMLTASSYNPVVGRDALERGELARVFPEATRTSSHYMSAALAADLRLWLVEPDAPKAQRQRLELDEAQRRLASTRTQTGLRRITGPAGSGKSIVLAARAARLVADGKDVLVVTFNITLLNYLADAAVRNEPKARKTATWLNFHHWCKRVCEDTDHEMEYRKLWHTEDGFPDAALCCLVESILDSDAGTVVPRYDAVLVDEGQDFRPEWWSLLRRVCRPGGEMVLAADATQDVYGTARTWTDGAMRGAGFVGNWARLAVSYRMPPSLVDYAREFAREFLPADTVDLPVSHQLELDLAPCRLRWVQADPEAVAATAKTEAVAMLTARPEAALSVSDLTVLADSHELGERVVQLLQERGVRSIHTFAEDQRASRRAKLAFFMGDARVKVTTLHSFKGWEARALLVCLGRAQEQRSRALLYAGLTRLKRHPNGSCLTVVCGDPDLALYGRTWPAFQAGVGPEERPGAGTPVAGQVDRPGTGASAPQGLAR